MGSITPLPYWQINVPPSLRTAHCPPFLAHLNAKDLGIISTPDAAYHILTWAEVRALIRQNRIDLFQRIPSDLRRYLEYNARLKQQHGSVMDFVLSQRLHWALPITPTGSHSRSSSSSYTPFAHADQDVKILYNDWPYGIDARIVHLVVWTKFELEDDPATGELTASARADIDAYVRRVFGDKLGADNVIWFKNWKSLKSVHSVEDFHVMLYDPPPAFVEEVTGGDVPLSRKV